MAISDAISVCFRFEQYAQQSSPTDNPRKLVRLPNDSEWHELIGRLAVCVSPRLVQDMVQMRSAVPALDAARQHVLVLNSVVAPTVEELENRARARDELERSRRAAIDEVIALRRRLGRAARPRWWRTPEDQISWWLKALVGVVVAAAVAAIGAALAGSQVDSPPTTIPGTQPAPASTSP